MKGSSNGSCPIFEMEPVIKRNSTIGHTPGDGQADGKWEGVLRVAICCAATKWRLQLHLSSPHAQRRQQSGREMNPSCTVVVKYYKQNKRSWVAPTCIRLLDSSVQAASHLCSEPSFPFENIPLLFPNTTQCHHLVKGHAWNRWYNVVVPAILKAKYLLWWATLKWSK